MSIYRTLAALWLLASATAVADIGVNPGTYQALTSDRRAYQVGDLLTVLVVESTTAESAAGTGAKANTSIAASAGNQDNSYSVNLGTSGDTSGTGQTSRHGLVRTKVAVRILQLDEGLFQVGGQQEVTVNDERQTVSVLGWIRPDDIAGDNTVLSTRMANASIRIDGDGVVSQAQKQNIFFRFFKWLRLI
jgi:flagellar L-ring protein precursor FlgH